MEHTTIAEPTGFGELSKAEQIRYLQALWDRIVERPGEIPGPESHSSSQSNGLPTTAATPAKLHQPMTCSIAWQRRIG